MFNHRLFYPGLITALVFGANSGSDEKSTCKQTEDVLNELRKIRELLESQSRLGSPLKPAAPSQSRLLEFDVGGAPSLGSEDAPISLAQFTDFQCQYCNRFFREVLPKLKTDYVASGKVRFFSLDLPLKVHQNSLRAAEAGRCALRQGHFWPMHDLMQDSPDHLQMEDLLRFADSSGISVEDFQSCVNTGEFEKSVRDQADKALAKGIRGTPAMILGRSRHGIVEGELLIGAIPYSTLADKIDLLLAESKGEPLNR